MPVDFLTAERQRRYGRYSSEPSPTQLERYFHLDDTDCGHIARCRHDHTRLGFAVQLGTVRFLGTFLADPSEVPRGVVAYLARQLGIADTRGLERYAAGEMRRDHVAEIRSDYGYRDFHEGTKATALYHWLANRAWVSAERPSVLFDLATARLVERKVLLPGVTVLARLVAQVRDQAASRLWRTLARTLKPGQAARLETLLVADEHSRQSPLERLRRAPTRVSVVGMVEALERLQEIRALGVSHIDLSTVPPVRIQVLARYAALARAQAITRMPPPRRRATLLAFAKIQEAAATDDVMDLLDQLISAMLSRVEAAGQRRRLRTLKDLDSAALLLHEACLLRADVTARLPRVDLTEILLEVQAWTGFATEFHHVSEADARVADLDLSLCAVLLAEACNVGLGPLVRPNVPALTRGRLSWVQQNYIRAETITKANARLVDYQAQIPLAQAWGGGEVASADGLRFVVPVRSAVDARFAGDRRTAQRGGGRPEIPSRALG